MKYKIVKRDNYKIKVYNIPGTGVELMISTCAFNSCR